MVPVARRQRHPSGKFHDAIAVGVAVEARPGLAARIARRLKPQRPQGTVVEITRQRPGAVGRQTVVPARAAHHHPHVPQFAQSGPVVQIPLHPGVVLALVLVELLLGLEVGIAPFLALFSIGSFCGRLSANRRKRPRAPRPGSPGGCSSAVRKSDRRAAGAGFR